MPAPAVQCPQCPLRGCLDAVADANPAVALFVAGSLPPSPADSGVSDVDSSSSGHTSNDELRARLHPSAGQSSSTSSARSSARVPLTPSSLLAACRLLFCFHLILAYVSVSVLHVALEVCLEMQCCFVCRYHSILFVACMERLYRLCWWVLFWHEYVPRSPSKLK